MRGDTDKKEGMREKQRVRETVIDRESEGEKRDTKLEGD